MIKIWDRNPTTRRPGGGQLVGPGDSRRTRVHSSIRSFASSYLRADGSSQVPLLPLQPLPPASRLSALPSSPPPLSPPPPFLPPSLPCSCLFPSLVPPVQVGNIIPVAETRQLHLGKSELACSLPSVEKGWRRSLGFAEDHNPLEGRSHVWVTSVSPVPGWTYDSVKVPVPCQMIQEVFRKEGNLSYSFKD